MVVMKQIGKRGRQWQATRRLWIKNNPPDHAGYYICGLCGQYLHSSEMTLDHILKRGSHPEEVNNLANLRPVHAYCNAKREW